MPIDARPGGKPWEERKKHHEEEREEALAAMEKPAAEAEAQVKLVPRILGFPLRYRDPDSGEIREMVIISQVPDGKTQEMIGRDTVARNTGLAWEVVPPPMRNRAYMLATCTYQIQNMVEWLWERLQEDPELLDAVYARLGKHASDYFRGDVRPGDAGKIKPRLVVGEGVPVSPAVSARGA